jgi:hypothetical protein
MCKWAATAAGRGPTGRRRTAASLRRCRTATRPPRSAAAGRGPPGRHYHPSAARRPRSAAAATIHRTAAARLVRFVATAQPARFVAAARPQQRGEGGGGGGGEGDRRRGEGRKGEEGERKKEEGEEADTETKSRWFLSKERKKVRGYRGDIGSLFWSRLFIPTGTKDNWSLTLPTNFFEPGLKIKFFLTDL